jgi:hypothetical protein
VRIESSYYFRTYSVFQLLSGEVLEGFDIVRTIESCGSQSGKTSAIVAIAESGVVGSDARNMDGADGENVFVR